MQKDRFAGNPLLAAFVGECDGLGLALTTRLLMADCGVLRPPVSILRLLLSRRRRRCRPRCRARRPRVRPRLTCDWLFARQTPSGRPLPGPASPLSSSCYLSPLVLLHCRRTLQRLSYHERASSCSHTTTLSIVIETERAVTLCVTADMALVTDRCDTPPRLIFALPSSGPAPRCVAPPGAQAPVRRGNA